LIEKQELQEEGICSTFVWGSKVIIQEKGKWIEIGRVRDIYLHLSID